MANVRLEIPESQVIALVRQLSPAARQVVRRMLAAEQDELVGEWEGLADEDTLLEWWDEEDDWDEYPPMSRRQLLAAETFHYSYANYADHLGSNVRFDEMMPDDVDILEEAEQEGWDDATLAEALEIEEDQVEFWRESYRRAKDIVDAPTPAESFRRGVRYSIRNAVEEGLTDEAAIEKLIVQVCYRAADLAYLLDQAGETLSRYSQELRKEPGVTYFDQDMTEPSG